ncbi:uncharacterized protein J7T54_002174 [Emericellopsis cladophorae]|uniref:Uncharacterized protein n=1 Tax=Emericellopsis cladophorae TaxID=2686198 RepID=A0A9P9Y3W1_9HYPO|nr:uncharacterized protein J7T54_002174 [Emericellopsis cladophorae]KAI6783012.1 hypothetical protein J7T54_002174 [Emericellopsis cladophorae]
MRKSQAEYYIRKVMVRNQKLSKAAEMGRDEEILIIAVTCSSAYNGMVLADTTSGTGRDPTYEGLDVPD